MRLSELVDSSIANFPSLYRVPDNPRLSRHRVLEHLFFTIGNGYEWDRAAGCLIADSCEAVILPEDYYQLDLYSFTVADDKTEEFKDLLQGRYYHVRLDESKTVNTIHFNATREEVKEWHPVWDTSNRSHVDNADVRITRFNPETMKIETVIPDIHPYILSKYSALIELLNGRTTSCHQNFNFSEYPVQQEWLDAAVEIAQEVLAYYQDESRYANHYHCRMNRRWELLRQEQIHYLRSFLNKFS